MRTKNLFLLLSCFICLTARAQLNQLYDNVSYKALYLKEASKLIASDPNLLLLDVRSPGEYAENSQSLTLNMGRLKGSVNISIDSIRNHLKDLEQYKDKTILVYCSHSQRSRVVSKLLADNGFKHVNSLNGGMSLVNRSTDAEFPAKAALYTSSLPYELIQSVDAYNFIRNKKNVIIDLRPAAGFNGTDSIADNNIGRIKGAINIPANALDGKMNTLDKYKNRPVMLYDLHNSESVDAALKLTKAGFKKVYVLFEGLSTLMVNTPSGAGLRTELFVSYPKYKIIGPRETIAIVDHMPNILIADVRDKSLFENKGAMSFLNLGHIKNAQNLPDIAAIHTFLKGKPKSTPVLIYGSGMEGMKMKGVPVSVPPSDICRLLAAEGYTNIYLLGNGLYSVFWAITNVEDCRNGMAILTDHKGLY
ncbi:hypothetical protein BH09BAC6_BH09BAC6_21490 [soil metagenome]|jgi:rhodanese-related sulfurtransferase